MSLKKLVKNLKMLSKKRLSPSCFETPDLDAIIEEKCIDMFDQTSFLKIYNVMETIDSLTNSNDSVARFGDGELQLILGHDIPFQKASKLLSARLQEVLASNINNVRIALPYFIYHSKHNLNDVSRDFWTKNGKLFRDTIAKYISTENTYLAAEFTIAADAYKQFDKEKYFSCIQRIWANKDITIICGKTVFDKIDNNIFANAKSIEYQYAPSLNAFEEYANILQSSQQIDKKRLVIIILGPTAKVLAYDMSQLGYRALDLGHIAKAYDWYIKGQSTVDINDAIEFFNPD